MMIDYSNIKVSPRQVPVRIVILILLLVQSAAQAWPASAQTGLTGDLQKFILPGETAVEMVPVVYQGTTYRLFYFTTRSDLSRRNTGELFFESSEEQWNNLGVQAILVTDENLQPITNDDLLRGILMMELAGYLHNTYTEIPNYAPADEQTLKDMTDLTGGFWGNVAFLDKKLHSLLKGDTEESLDTEALRQILAAPNENTGSIQDYSDHVINLVNTGMEFKDAVQAVAEMEKFANDKSIRDTAKESLKIFDKWNKISTPSGLRGEIAGQDVSFANWLDLGELVIHLAFLEQLSSERAENLQQIANAGRAGKINISTDLLSAIDTVVLEAQDPSFQRASIIDDFVRDHIADLAQDVGLKVITDSLTQWTWEQFGTQVTGHLVAGAIASVTVGLTIADVLYGRDDVYANLVTAEHAARIAQELFDDLKALHQNGNPPSAYQEGDTLYLQMTVVYNLAVSQWYQSYSTTVASGRLLTGLADLFTGDQWTQAQEQFSQWAQQGDDDTYSYLIHPDIIEYAILTALARASLGIEPLTETVFVMDVSGSMADTDPTGGRKIDAAKRAMNTLLRMIRAENHALGPMNMLSLVVFSDSATSLVDMGTDTQLVATAVAQMEPQGGTNLFDGLTMANTQMAVHTQPEKKIIIMLSDGEPTISPTYPTIYGPPFSSASIDFYNMQEEVLQGPVATALASGYCIYTIGFGDPTIFYQLSDGPFPQIDKNFLTKVAEETKCGDYLTASDASQLVKVYIKLHHASLGVLQAEQEGLILPQQTSQASNFNVPRNQDSLVGSVSYAGSSVNLILTDPHGQQVDMNYPGATIFDDFGLSLITVSKPQSGQWSMSVYGEDVPDAGESYYAAVSTRTNTISHTGGGGIGIALIVLLVAGGTIGSATLLTRRRLVPSRSRTGQTSRNQLIAVSGPLAGRTFPLIDGMLIGRSSACQLQLPDRMVSRQHARLRYSEGRWYIQDVGSHSGIEINGARIQASVLNNGDRIRIGSSDFEFRLG
jgi:hypothetical protein